MRRGQCRAGHSCCFGSVSSHNIVSTSQKFASVVCKVPLKLAGCLYRRGKITLRFGKFTVKNSNYYGRQISEICSEAGDSKADQNHCQSEKAGRRRHQAGLRKEEVGSRPRSGIFRPKREVPWRGTNILPILPRPSLPHARCQVFRPPCLRRLERCFG